MQLEGTPEQIIALVGALIAAQAEFPPIPKTKDAYNYKYAPLPEIHDKIRPVLLKYELGVFHSINRSEGKSCIGTTVFHKLGGRASCEGLPIPETAKIQDQGGIVTYGMRYGTCAMLGIASQDDNDAAPGKSPRQAPRRVGVAQRGRAALDANTGPSGDAGSSPDPTLPTKEERSKYARQLNQYIGLVESQDLEAYVLGQSGASEGRLVKKSQWDDILRNLDQAFSTGGAFALKKLVGGSV